MKAREYTSPLIEKLLSEVTPEEMEKIEQLMEAMNRKQQTAVEWLLKQLDEKAVAVDVLQIRKINITINTSDYMDIRKQARKMEKEQIINTWSEATAPDHEIGLSDAPYIITQIKKAEQYYNETYEK
jgi:hypothetical protein